MGDQLAQHMQRFGFPILREYEGLDIICGGGEQQYAQYKCDVASW